MLSPFAAGPPTPRRTWQPARRSSADDASAEGTRRAGSARPRLHERSRTDPGEAVSAPDAPAPDTLPAAAEVQGELRDELVAAMHRVPELAGATLRLTAL